MIADDVRSGPNVVIHQSGPINQIKLVMVAA